VFWKILSSTKIPCVQKKVNKVGNISTNIIFIIKLTRRVSLVEQELLTLPEHPSSPPVFSGVRVTRSLVLCVCFADRCLSLCSFSFGHCVVCSSLIYRILHYAFLRSSKQSVFYSLLIKNKWQEEFEDTKGVIRSRKSKNDRQHNGQEKGQKDKQWSTKHKKRIMKNLFAEDIMVNYCL
jgi:hypothetical protein